MKTKRLLTLLFVLLFLNSCVLRSLAVISSADLKEKPTAEVTIKYEDTYGLMIVPIVIDGKTYRFVFDTGAGTTVVSKEISELKAFKKKGQIKVNDAQQLSNKLLVGRISEMTMSNFHYSKVGVIVNDFSKNEQFRCLRIDGILGMNVLKMNNWKVDYDKMIITGYDQQQEMTAPEDSYLFPFVTKVGSPFINLSVDNKTEKFMIDTGKSSDLISVSSDVKLEGKSHESVGKGSFGMFGKTEIDTTFYFQADFSDTTGFDMANIAVTQTRNIQSNIGNGFLKKNYHYVLFDFKNRRMHCCIPKTASNNYASYGISAIMSGETLVIGSKDINFSPQTERIALQDTIVEMNGMRLINDNLCEIIESVAKFKQSKSAVILKVKHSGEEIELTLPYEDIFMR